jgi:hypothetical protein
MKFQEKKRLERKSIDNGEDIETSDDDYVDPSMDKYFKNKDKKTTKKAEKNGKKEELSESESDYEEPEELEEEESDVESESEPEEDDEEEEQDDDDGVDGADADEKMDINEGDGEENDGREKITLKTIKSWSSKLAVFAINVNFN